MAVEFKLPVMGENIASGTISKIMVAVGDVVAVDQSVIEIETDKAVLEIPSSVAGKITEIRVQAGKTVAIGDVVFVVEADVSTPSAAPKRPAPDKATPLPPSSQRPAPPPTPQPPLPPPAPEPARPTTSMVLAAPSVRRMAGELGVNVEDVAGTGSHGRVTLEDVRAFAEHAAPAPPPPSQEPPPPIEADRDRWGAIERQPMNAVRRKTALHMANAWRTIPHVTHFDRADITSLEAFRQRYANRAEAVGGKLTAAIVIVKILAAALRKFPQFNASVDMENQELVLKKYVNIGVAVDTDAGLLVPVVRDADRKTLLELAVEIAVLAGKARARRLSLDEMSGGTFTVTNLGGLGGTDFTPIINAPEAAILGLSRARIEPVFVNGAFAPRTMLPLALSYDHRAVDGADAARFVRWLAEAIEQPLVLMLDE